MKKLHKILSVLLVMILILCSVNITVFAAHYPSIYFNMYESSSTIPQGETGKIVFEIHPKNYEERYNVEIYDSNGNIIGSVSETYYNPDDTIRELDITIDTSMLEMAVGKYRIIYWLDYYSDGNWYSSPKVYFIDFDIIANTCHGEHDLQVIYVEEYAHCNQEGIHKMYCPKCWYNCFVNIGYGNHGWNWYKRDDETHLKKCIYCGEEVIENHTLTCIEVIEFPTFIHTGIGQFVCYCKASVQSDIEKLQNGWNLIAGKWYFGEKNALVKDDWRKDSKGWVYLGSDGAMKTNTWVRDSVGWCYVGADGYAVTNCWKKDSIGWCYLNSNGSMVKNNWVLDGGKWYFIDGNGYMISNVWQKDSKGWVYLGSDGAMKTNAWIRDSVGWCYVGADGYAVTNCWKNDSTGWCYLNSNGSMVKNNWVLDGGKWYFLDGNGYMISSTWRYIGGKNYYFNAAGICTNP